MRVYKDKDQRITIVYGPNEKPAGVLLVKDYGRNIKNDFADEYARYQFHWANVTGNTPYSSEMNESPLDDSAIAYNLVKSRRQRTKKKAKL